MGSWKQRFFSTMTMLMNTASIVAMTAIQKGWFSGHNCYPEKLIWTFQTTSLSHPMGDAQSDKSFGCCRHIVVYRKRPLSIAPCKAFFFFSTKNHLCFLISPWKHILWVLIRSTTEALLMSTHNICFHGEIWKIFMLNTPLIWSYAYQIIWLS